MKRHRGDAVGTVVDVHYRYHHPADDYQGTEGSGSWKAKEKLVEVSLQEGL